MPKEIIYRYDLLSRVLMISGFILLSIGCVLPIAYYELASINGSSISILSIMTRANDKFMIPVYFLTILYPYLFGMFLLIYIIFERALSNSGFKRIFSGLFYFFSFYSMFWLWIILSYLLFQDVGLNIKSIIGILLILMSILFYVYYSNKRRKESNTDVKVEYSLFIACTFIVCSIVFGIIVLSHYESLYDLYSGNITEEAYNISASGNLNESSRYMKISYGVYFFIISSILMFAGSALNLFAKAKDKSE